MMTDFILLFFCLLKAFFVVLLFIFIYFISLESLRRYKCKIGVHAEPIRNGELACRTCFKEVGIGDNKQIKGIK